MLLKSDAYDACIGYFSENLDIFEGKGCTGNGKLISDIVSDQVVEMLLTFCQQHPQLTSEVRLSVIADGDKLVDDLEQMLGRFWNKSASVEQTQFIEEYFLLLKNSLDSQVPNLPS
jgi:hypothetical protein